MKITFQFTYQQFKDSLALHARQSFWRLLHYRMFDLGIPLIAAIVLVFRIPYLIANGKFWILDSFAYTAMWISLLVVLPIVRDYSRRRVYRGWFPPDCDDKTMTYELNEEEVIVTKTAVGQGKYPWASVHAIAEDSRTILLYLTPLTPISIPKSVLSGEQLLMLNDLIARHVPARKS